MTPDLYYQHQTGTTLFDLLTLKFRRPLRNCGTLQHGIPLVGRFEMCTYSISEKCQLLHFLLPSESINGSCGEPVVLEGGSLALSEDTPLIEANLAKLQPHSPTTTSLYLTLFLSRVCFLQKFVS